MNTFDETNRFQLTPSLECRVLGSGNAYDTQRHNSSILLSRPGVSVLIDCGPWVTKRLLNEVTPDEINEIYFTHTHPDHCLGLTTLTNWMSSRGRKAQLIIHCLAEQQTVLQSLVDFGCWPGSRHTFSVTWKPIEATGQIAGYSYQSAPTEHSVSNRSICIEYAHGRSMFYSGDGRITKAGHALAAKSQIVFVECEQLMPCRSHNSLEDILALDKHPHSEWFLYHVDPECRQAIAHALKNEPNVSLLREAG